MQTIHRNPNVMWREEEDALARVREALARGEEAEETGTSVLFSGGTMLSLNYLGTEIWKLCDGRTMEEIVAELFSRFDVEEAVLWEDLQAFLDELAAKGFITYGK